NTIFLYQTINRPCQTQPSLKYASSPSVSTAFFSFVPIVLSQVFVFPDNLFLFLFPFPQLPQEHSVQTAHLKVCPSPVSLPDSIFPVLFPAARFLLLYPLNQRAGSTFQLLLQLPF